MPDITLASEPRTELGSGPSGRLRKAGKVPAVVYGLGSDPVSISVPARELSHVLAGEAGANTLINLDVNGESVLTLARQIHRHPTRGEFVHVDFVRIRRDVAVSADIPVNLNGEPKGVKDGGLLEQLLFSVTIEAMPGNIPVSIEHDITGLEIGEQVLIGGLALPDGVTTPMDEAQVVVQVTARRSATTRGGGEGEEGEGEEGGAPAASAPAAESEGDGE
ncbi:MAG: 50S ribosomal protein L25 [Acidimicrobiia bacterium]